MYVYEVEKNSLFTESGQRDFLAVRDNVEKLIKQSGAVRTREAVSVIAGDSFFQLACVDRLVELGEIVEVQRECVGQHRVFVSARIE